MQILCRQQLENCEAPKDGKIEDEIKKLIDDRKDAISGKKGVKNMGGGGNEGGEKTTIEEAGKMLKD